MGRRSTAGAGGQRPAHRAPEALRRLAAELRERTGLPCRLSPGLPEQGQVMRLLMLPLIGTGGVSPDDLRLCKMLAMMAWNADALGGVVRRVSREGFVDAARLLRIGPVDAHNLFEQMRRARLKVWGDDLDLVASCDLHARGPHDFGVQVAWRIAVSPREVAAFVAATATRGSREPGT